MVDASLRATILESLLTLNREFGISFVYITHDLTTAYQISETVDRPLPGRRRRGGRRPARDPGTRSTPTRSCWSARSRRPTPSNAGARRTSPARGDAAELTVRVGCTFAPRCPHVMPMCREASPPLYLTNGAAVACYLYRDAPVLEGGDLTPVLAGAAARVGGNVVGASACGALVRRRPRLGFADGPHPWTLPLHRGRGDGGPAGRGHRKRCPYDRDGWLGATNDTRRPREPRGASHSRISWPLPGRLEAEDDDQKVRCQKASLM